MTADPKRKLNNLTGGRPPTHLGGAEKAGPPAHLAAAQAGVFVRGAAVHTTKKAPTPAK